MNDFDQVVRQTMSDVADHTPPAADFADRLIANARTGRVTVTPLARVRRGVRWTTPLLAAAVVILIAGGLAVTRIALGSAHHVAPPISHPSPQPVIRPTSLPSPSHPTSAPTQPGFSATDVFLKDARHGWAIGDGRCAASAKRNCATLIRTTDGRTWSKVPVPPGLVSTKDEASCGTNGAITGPCVDHVLFANSRDGYLWSLHELYVTIDGGAHWTREAHSPGHTGATQLIVVGNHVARIRPVEDCSSSCPGVLQSATIGSTEWKTVTPAVSGLFSSRLAGHGSTAYFLSGPADGSDGGGLFRTSDGVNWTALAQRPCGTDAYGLAAGFDGSLVVSCRGGTQVRIAPAGSTQFGTAHAVPGESPELIALLSAQQLIMIDGHRVYRSTDGGAHFTPVAQLDVNLTPVAASPDLLYAVNANGSTLYESTTGGATWAGSSF